MNDEEKYKSLRASLKSLPKVKARAGFEDKLFQRIKQLEQGEVQSQVKPVSESKFKGWFANLFRPSLAPALGLTVILLVGIIVYFAYYSQLNKELSGEPKQYSISNSEQKPEFVIYIRKDTSNNASNYPHEYSGLTSNEIQTTTSVSKQDLGKVSSDFNATKPAPSVDDKIHDDRISPEQKLQMQRSSDIESKDSKVVGKTRSEKKENNDKKAPSNFKREDDRDIEKNDNSKDGTIKQENAPLKGDETETGKNNDNVSGDSTSGKAIPNINETKTLSKSQIDSLKAKQKAPLNTEEPDSTKK